MNQILFSKVPEGPINIDSKRNHKKEKRKKIYQGQLYIASGFLVILFLVFLGIRLYQSNREKYSKVLLNQYRISTLYADTQNVIRTSSIAPATTTPFIIGMLEIDAIKLNYPILSESTPELLSIAPCRFAGPMPNEVGNLCIAGHNYADKRFFGRLHELSYGDVVKVFDLSGNREEYVVSETAKIASNDTRCTRTKYKW